MPKRPAGGQYVWRDRFVQRLTDEQTFLGWSDAGLAKRVSAYFPMSAATVWKIKMADPPRRIDLDEAMAISRAFGYDTVDEFLAGEGGSEWLTGDIIATLQAMVSPEGVFSGAGGQALEWFTFAETRSFTPRQIERSLAALYTLRQATEDRAAETARDARQALGAIEEVVAVIEAKREGETK